MWVRGYNLYLSVRIVFGVRYICKDWLAEQWNRIISGNDDHLQAGTQVERSRGFKHTMGYCAKYVAKPTDYQLDDELKGQEIGRHWGIANRSVFYGLLGDKKSIHLTSLSNQALLYLLYG